MFRLRAILLTVVVSVSGAVSVSGENPGGTPAPRHGHDPRGGRGVNGTFWYQCQYGHILGSSTFINNKRCPYDGTYMAFIGQD